MRPLLAPALALALWSAPGIAAAEGPATTEFARLGPFVIHGNEADNLLVGVGAWDLRDETSPAGTVEYRFGRKVFVVGFSFGLIANTKGGLFGYSAIYTDWSYGNVFFTPQIGMGGYHEGASSDLGGIFQFRLSFDVAYRFQNGHRLGIRAGHISNANTQPSNPGEEDLLLIYSIPFGPYL